MEGLGELFVLESESKISALGGVPDGEFPKVELANELSPDPKFLAARVRDPENSGNLCFKLSLFLWPEVTGLWTSAEVERW